MANSEIELAVKGLQCAKDYADAVLLEPLKQLGGILSDSIGLWRLKNQVRILLKSKQMLDDNGIDHTKILPDIFVPLLEEGGNVEDDNLQNMFASLLASHLNPNLANNVHPSFSKVIAQLSPIDALAIVEFNLCPPALGLRPQYIEPSSIASRLKISDDQAYLSCLNLERLGLVFRRSYERTIGQSRERRIPFQWIAKTLNREYGQFNISLYGDQFCIVCCPGKKL